MSNPQPSSSKPSLDGAAVEALTQRVRGGVIAPAHPDYDVARGVYNAMIDCRPALVARCADAADVMAGVDFAREHGLLLAVRGGGHNVAGLGTCDGGMVLDLSPMRSVRVDPTARIVRVGGGATWGDVDHATDAFGLAVPGGTISTTGVAGLTLGGGSGHLTRKYGLTIDNLISADVVTADGRFVTASGKENPDLFWALRGGGGNFGVVTSFEFRAHPVRKIYCGPVFYPIDKTGEVLRFYREFIAEAPEEVGAFFGFHQGPPAPFIPAELQGVPMAAIIACYAGPEEKAEKALKPLQTQVKPAIDVLHWATLAELNAAFDGLLPPGMQHYWKAEFLTEINDAIVDVNVKHGPKVPSVNSLMHIYPTDGAASRVGKTDTAFNYREAKFSSVIVGVDPDPARAPERIKWVRDFWEDLHAHSAGGAYVNFLMEEGDDRVAGTYRENFDRLQKIKAKYDPENLFRRNQNIKPKA
jgi:UDP-N-acetylenolpyruvoylglucosamine reductase